MSLLLLGLLLVACGPVAPGFLPPEGTETASHPGDSADSADSARESTGRDTSVEDTTLHDTSPPDEAWRSTLYPADWTPGFAVKGRFLHDFSYAGYHAGEAPLPTAFGPTFDVTAYGADPTGATDATAAVQAAIDAASILGADLPRVVAFPAGTYRIDGLLRVAASSVVLQGAGSSATFLYFTTLAGVEYGAHLTYAGAVSQGPDRALSVDGAVLSHQVMLADAAGLAIGDQVAVGWTITDAFVEEHGMTGIWEEFNGSWRTFFRRTVVAVDPGTGTVTLDVPLRYAAQVRDGASLRVETGYLTEVGLDALAVSNAANYADAWATNQVHAVLLSGVRDAWVRDVRSWASPHPTDGNGLHLLSSGVEVLDSRRVTIADTELAYSQHRGGGGNGYLFEISRSNEVLTVDSSARGGRHNYIQNWDFGTSGCVWLRTTSAEGRALLGDWDPVGYAAYSEFHHSLAQANLIDQSVASDGWQAVNRQSESSGAGHAATQSVWWNISGGGYLRSLQVGDGYIIGTADMDVHTDPDELDWNDSGEGTAPEDWTEGLDAASTLDPPSLYEDQLLRRMAR